MIGFLSGTVVFSDGQDLILNTASGVGYQIFCQQVLAEGSRATLYISHVIKEASQELYGFSNLREKKLFELLTTVKGVGPKSAYSMLANLGGENIITAVMMENKALLKKAPGVGDKAASQLILDLKSKIAKAKMYSSAMTKWEEVVTPVAAQDIQVTMTEMAEPVVTNENQIIQDALMACKELGFKEDKIIPLAQKIMNEANIQRAEQLVHLVLKEV
ncbi:MAG: Holliday junction branch migration protein RuvA [Deltaproteobacteria bacterium]|jgi:holliday junction DNA helicase RuvA|nr:MAG: Holliday junction branch migration protein RuvA [Deltaproteobacteria bacterium]